MSAGIPGTIAELVAARRADGQPVLLEPDGLAVAAALGIGVPHHQVLPNAAAASSLDLRAFGSDRVVVKVLSPTLPHRTDLGGVRVVTAEPSAVRAAVEDMERRFAARDARGFLVSAFVPHDSAPGSELLVALRWTDDFGPVVVLGPGGAGAEFLAAQLEGGRGAVAMAPGLTSDATLERLLAGRAVARLATGRVRGATAHADPGGLRAIFRSLLDFASSEVACAFAELEFNPLVWTPAGPMALDALGRLREPSEAGPARPLANLGRLLRPRSIAVVGVSDRANPGRVILQNTLRSGFPPDRLTVIKAGASSIDGVRCLPDLDALPEPVDLLVLSVAADRVPDLLHQVVAQRRAESVVVIPGGVGERSGTEHRARAVVDALRRSRATPWGGPVVNGGNCLGIRSVPGRYDTTFIPDYKLPRRPTEPAPVALIAQSGALAVSLSSKLPGVNPRYVITVGNQIDLTVGDYLTHFADDAEVQVFGCYVEGFRPLDGRRFLEAAAAVTARGGQVILYRAGRTAAGADAMISHTTAVAGDYAVARELAEAVGVTVADSLDDLADLVRLHAALVGRRPRGWRLGAASNAGFECVAIADALGPFTLAAFNDHTRRALGAVLEAHHLEDVVGVRNPVDLTPIVGDAGYEEAIRAILADDGVDVGIVGCVPLTGALATLPRAAGHREDAAGPDSVVSRLARVHADTLKPWVAVVDAGSDYDAAVALLAERGVPTFRTADRALDIFGRCCRSYLEPVIGRASR